MKIRIKGDSIRFRLTKTEVEELCNKGRIEEVTHFKSNTFTYAVQQSQAEGLSASMKANTITLYINEAQLQGWDTDNTVGFENVEKLDSNTELSLLLEKDFVCLDQRLEDQSDNYPNPKMQTHQGNL